MIHAVDQNVVEADEADVHPHARQCLQNPVVGVGLLVGQGVRHRVGHPRTHGAPGIQHCHIELALGRPPLGPVVQIAELVCDAGHGLNELGELGRQGWVAAVAHARYGAAQDGPTGLAPIVQPLDAGIVALMEGIREEVWQKTTFGVADPGNIGDHAQGGAVAHGPDHSIQTQLLEARLVGLGADPLVSQEHHGFLACLVGHVDHGLDILPHKIREEIDPIALCPARNAEGGVVAALVDEVLRTQTVTVPGLEIIQGLGGDCAGISEPVHQLLPVELVEDQRELVEEGGEPDHVGRRVLIQPLPIGIHDELSGGRMVDVQGNLVFLVAPVVGQVVVHLDRIPDDVSQEGCRVLMHGGGPGHANQVLIRIQAPLRLIQDPSGGAVDDLPVPVGVGIPVGPELLVEIAVHQGNLHLVFVGQYALRHQVDLWGLVHVLADPLVVGASREVGAVHLHP